MNGRGEESGTQAEAGEPGRSRQQLGKLGWERPSQGWHSGPDPSQQPWGGGGGP